VLHDPSRKKPVTGSAPHSSRSDPRTFKGIKGSLPLVNALYVKHGM
jgi:hypothetical protein